MIRVVVLAGAVLAVSAALAGAAPPPQGSSTGANAVLVRITIPGEETVSLGELTWPTNLSADVQSFQFPDDGSIVSLGRSRALGIGADGGGGHRASRRRGGRAHALRRRAHRGPGGRFDHGRSESAVGRSRRVCIRGSRPACTRAGPCGDTGLDGLARRVGCRLGALRSERQSSRGPTRRAGERRRAPRDADCGARWASGRQRDSHRQRAGHRRGSGSDPASPAGPADAPA